METEASNTNENKEVGGEKAEGDEKSKCEKSLVIHFF
jgi:hypothetical protein